MFKKKTTSDKRSRQPSRSLPERRNIVAYRASRTPGKSADESRNAKPFAPPKPAGIAWWKQLPMIIATLAILVCIVDALLLSTNPRIVSLATASNQVFLRPISVYQQAAEQQLNHSIFNRNKLTVNAAGVSRALEQQFPELAQVSVTLPLIGHRPVVYVAPETPALVLASQNGDTFIISDSGKALIPTTAVAQPNSFKLPVITDQSGLSVQSGRAALPAANVSFIQTVLAQFQAQNVSIGQLVLPVGGSEFDVHLGGQGYFVKFNLEGEVTQQVGAFMAVRNYLASNHLTPAQYVDVRVPGRAYYR